MHVLNGNPGRRPLPEAIPVPRERPDPPAHYDEHSAKLWDYFVGAVEAMGVLSTIDAPAMEMLVDSWRLYREAQVNVRKYGSILVIDKEKRQMSVNPYVRVRKQYFTEVMDLLKQFGFTPVARAQLARGVEKNDEEADPLDAIFSARVHRN
tara:strand:+ start:2684 stop:3136 length:453 start_codon:yes stop_codon:yes gene_type:complete